MRSALLALFMNGVLLVSAQVVPKTQAPLQPTLTAGSKETFAFIGGKSLASFQQPAYFETLLTASLPSCDLRFRDLTRDGDTASTQPREINYPTPFEQARKVQATQVWIQFGQMESIAAPDSLLHFMESLSNVVQRIQQDGAKPVILTPIPFFPSAALNPDLVSARNARLSTWSQEIQNLGRHLNVTTLDVFQEIVLSPKLKVWRSADSLEAQMELQHHLSLWCVRHFAPTSSNRKLHAKDLDPSISGSHYGFTNPELEQLRQLVLHKNKQWFHYSRPTNWAFLAGDRTEQLSSRDHINPKIRWFPAELEEFVPIIANAESNIRRHTQLHWGAGQVEKP